MSILTNVGVGIALTLTLALGVETYMIHNLDQKYASQLEANKDLNTKLTETNKSLATQNKLTQVTDKAIVDTANRIDSNTIKGQAIKDVVDNIANKVADEKLSTSDADNAYVDSMWSAYCASDKGASGCSARLANSKL